MESLPERAPFLPTNAKDGEFHDGRGNIYTVNVRNFNSGIINCTQFLETIG